MEYRQLDSEHVTESNRSSKWWHHRWVKVIGITLIILIVFSVTFGLILKLVILAPKKSETITTATSSPLTTIQSTTTTSLTTITTTTLLSTTTTTTQQSGKLWSNPP